MVQDGTTIVVTSGVMIRNCESTYDYTAVFYKGHFLTFEMANITCPWSCGNTHYFMYDNQTAGQYGGIKDYEIHSRMNSTKHDFVFLWMCEVGALSEIGGIDDDHAWGMLAAWMNTTDLSEDGYDSPDGTNRCFISFEKTSVDFCIPTKSAGNWNFGHFAYLFYGYVTDGYLTINDALDAAAFDTCDGEAFGATELYNGYNFTWYEEVSQDNWIEHEDTCYMRVYGDGDHIMPTK
jgi:hypothetical protein